MVAESAKFRSAELIDFEEARRKSRPSETDDGDDQRVAHPPFKDFQQELRSIEKRLDDIDARISALTALAPENIADLESALRPRAKETIPSPIKPPPRMAHIAPAPRRRPPPAPATDVAPLAELGAQNTSSATTPAIELAPRAPFRETLRRQRTRLTKASGNFQPLMRRRAASGLLTESIKNLFSAKTSARPVDGLNQGRRLIAAVARRLAGSFMSASGRTMAGVGAFLALGGFFLLIGPRPVATTKTSAVDQAQELRAPDARAAAAMKAAPAPGEVKINTLQTTVALLSPTPISGGGANRGLAAPAGDPLRSTEAPIASVSEPATESELAVSPAQGDAGALDARAAGGDAEAQYDYATELYQSGDTKGAISWLEKSAKQGNAKAQLQLGSLYLKGAGVTRNIVQARKWLEMAANNGDALAMHDLAVLYSGGEGRKPDYARASDWFRRAAEQGVVDSMFNLGVAYTDGLGVEKDLIQAYAWFSLAASQGDAKAAQKRKEIGRFLDREELSEGKILTDSLKLAQRSR